MGVTFFAVAQTLLRAFTAINIKPAILRAVACSVVICLIVIDIPGARIGNGICDYMMGATMASGILDSIHFLLLTRPLEEIRHESDKLPAYQLPFIQRYLWVSSITPRGIGWSFGVSRVLCALYSALFLTTVFVYRLTTSSFLWAPTISLARLS